MWIEYYKKTLRKLINLYEENNLYKKDIWVVLNSVLPFLIDNSKEGDLKEDYQDVYRELAYFNPIDEEGNDKFLSDDELKELVDSLKNIL